ncbi:MULTISPECIES: membrane lipoprotein lipid attachment site-containing protein [unclassified Facklamia]|uniref:membrane lipoprotein lipid attachment site-containing protein n=1 Tax=Aerococcaceae TaxID=186827 RepID=UPI0013B61AFD|nr:MULTISPECIES: membrane lipoprotein lipid attachment site-containing protein [unclassified Facklamia]NEW65308.1 hypothetical protein [Facklamia sp. 252]NEW68792.1 hypothetical protein [Facklamia sp. 253]QQD66103.1 membrane lipoprotein lipid attachment site-containing protein [Aerococcaceae bacterium zg-252]
MKKTILLAISVLTLAGCSNAITKQDLQKNEWVTDTSKIYDDVDIELKFHENNVDINIDSEDVYQVAIKQNPEMDNPLARAFFEQYAKDILKQSAPYTLQDGKLAITFTGPENETVDLYFVAKKEKNNIMLTLDPQNDGASNNLLELATKNGVKVEDIGLLLEPK